MSNGHRHSSRELCCGSLSARLTICLLAQSFIAGIAVKNRSEGLHALDAGLLLLIAAGLAVGLFD